MTTSIQTTGTTNTKPTLSTPTGNGNSITISRSERVFMVGTTGSGKTTLARELLQSRTHIVVLDPKHGWTWNRPRMDQTRLTGRMQAGDGVITSDPNVVLNWKGPGPLTFRPSLAMCKNLDGFWRWLWDRENTTLYIDELAMIIQSTQRLPDGLARLIQQGRQRNLGVWSATQRPSRIPIPVLSESEHTFTFRLRHPADLRRMSEYTDPLVENEPATGHDFWYYCDRDQTLFKTDSSKLKLKG